MAAVEVQQADLSNASFAESLAVRLCQGEGAAFDLEDLRATLGDGLDVLWMQVTTDDSEGLGQVVMDALAGAPMPILGMVGLLEVASRQQGRFEIRRLIPLLRTIAGDDAHQVSTFRLSQGAAASSRLSLWVRFSADARGAVSQWLAARQSGGDNAEGSSDRTARR